VFRVKKSITLISAVLLCTMVGFADNEPPKYEAFLGFTYLRANQFNQNFGLGQAIGGFSMYGGSGQFQYNFNKWISGVIDAGGVNKPNVGILNAQNTTAFTFGGPRFYWRHRHAVSLFGEVLFGAAYRHLSTEVVVLTGSDTPILPVANPSTLFPGPLNVVSGRLAETTTAFAMIAGGGVDWRLNKWFTARPVEVDYVLTRFPSLTTGFRENQSSIMASSGIVFTFGGEKAAPVAHRQIQMKTCPNGITVAADQPCPKQSFSVSITATPAELCPGETAQLTPSFSGVSPNQLTFSKWTVNGNQVSQSGSYQFNSDNLAPGTYQMKLTTGGDAFNPASAETTITVREYQPPTGTVQANPAVIRAGEKSALSSNFQGQCGGPIQPATYTASEGTIQGDQLDSSTIQWDASNNAEQRKTVTITAKAADNRNVGTATTNVEVVRGAVAAAVRLPDVLFPKNNSRVNNCGKRILLEQLRAYYERDPGGTVVLVGHNSSDETNPNLAKERAMNAAAVITAGTGVCLNVPVTQVQVSAPGADQNGVSYDAGFCRSSVGPIGPETEMRRVQVWFVPSGGQLPSSVTNAQTAATLSVSNLGCPK
jgi:outer membrane protein OmpA-like peptidoglycan-associated protein